MICQCLIRSSTHVAQHSAWYRACPVSVDSTERSMNCQSRLERISFGYVSRLRVFSVSVVILFAKLSVIISYLPLVLLAFLLRLLVCMSSKMSSCPLNQYTPNVLYSSSECATSALSGIRRESLPLLIPSIDQSQPYKSGLSLRPSSAFHPRGSNFENISCGICRQLAQ